MDIIDGRFIGNGDKNLFVKILGEGSPVVVIEPDWGSLSVDWSLIQTELAKKTTVVTYDRAGYGESPKSSFPRASAQVAGELFTMLQNSGLKGPYIFLAHGGGGLYIQHFIHMFANEVAGIVFVDSVSVNDMEFDKLDAPEYQKILSVDTRINNFNKYIDMNKKEFEAMVLPLLNNLYQHYPEDAKQQMVTYQSDQNFFKTIVDELETRAESIELLSSLSLFTNIPVRVLCHDHKVMFELSKQLGVPDDQARMAEELWLKNSKDLLKISTDSDLLMVEGAGHNIFVDNPNVILESIDYVIENSVD